jgi:hypothetical protein
MQLFGANKCGRFHSSLLIPQSIDLKKEEVMEKSNRLLSILLMNVDGSLIHETKAKDLITTQSNHLDPLINIFQNCSFSTTTNHPQTLKSLGCEMGIVRF